ncbi:MAG TPA: nucleoside-diphosphate sugar epimerase/dehydratase [Armatimonadota bacterium]|jgi:FlaA1/EpsC-like NDP-sugar epimerase
MQKLVSSRAAKIALKVTLETIAFIAASYLAFYLRFDGHILKSNQALWLDCLPLIIVVRLGCTWAFTRYRIAWRRVSMTDLAYVCAASTSGSIVLWLAVRAVHGAQPRGVLLLDWFLTMNFQVALRVAVRVMVVGHNAWHLRRLVHGAPGKRVLVVGAGYTGYRAVRGMKEDPTAGLHPVGFLDDDPAKHNTRIQGVPVLGPISRLAEMVRRHHVEQVVVAIPALPPARLREIVSMDEETPAHLTIMPSLPQTLSGKTATRLIRSIRVEDLLERTPVSVNMEGIAAYLTGERVLVTGAGGSIGSELCRQIICLNPASLIILGQGENSIFWTEHELRSEHNFHAIPVIADIKDRVKLEAVYQQYRPTVVFHAAAHKHVPLMEQNPEEAIKNNVFGTRNLAELSIEYGVKRFVMISTDKAVNPTSVMGTTKRVAEMVVQSLAQRIEALRNGDREGAMLQLNSIHAEHPITRFAAVRFGNVLGSRGSVVPTMQRQIEKGGPVTVTHAEMVRFFMTIPEAVLLVIQAGSMSHNGEVFVLDMGKPVKIMDLARNLIRLSGFTPDKDIPIKITGIRPGEKLYEEVLTAEEGTNITSHEKIFVARSSSIDHAALHLALERLELLAQRGNAAAIRETLHDIVPTYTPKASPPTGMRGVTTLVASS